MVVQWGVLCCLIVIRFGLLFLALPPPDYMHCPLNETLAIHHTIHTLWRDVLNNWSILNECGAMSFRTKPHILVISGKSLCTCSRLSTSVLLSACQILVLVHLSFCFVKGSCILLYQVILCNGVVCFNVVVKIVVLV